MCLCKVGSVESAMRLQAMLLKNSTHQHAFKVKAMLHCSCGRWVRQQVQTVDALQEKIAVVLSSGLGMYLGQPECAAGIVPCLLATLVCHGTAHLGLW
jgi:hypothetical protein